MLSRPSFTTCVDDIKSFTPLSKSSYIFGSSREERAFLHLVEWPPLVKKIMVTEREHGLGFYADVEEKEISVASRSRRSIREFAAAISAETIYLDITALECATWAPLIAVLYEYCTTFNIVYVEPRNYTRSAWPTEGLPFDLSERIRGVMPLPGFASLVEGRRGDSCFVPMLGFEGSRFRFVLEQIQPTDPDTIIPIVGLPGYKAEYPFYTYEGNKEPLRDTKSWRNVRFAAANCPFAALNTLCFIHNQFPSRSLKIAPIGTRPHALGAILFTLMNLCPTELVYDHPIHRQGRTEGVGRLLLYSLTPILKAAIGKNNG